MRSRSDTTHALFTLCTLHFALRWRPMRCPYCGHDETRVTDSRTSEDGVRRRRECLECSARFTTYERLVAPAQVMVIKKDGRREPFSREKILRGIVTACQKRRISRLSNSI